MRYKDEDYKKPVFEELEVTLYLTAGQENLLRNEAKAIQDIEGVETYLPYWNNNNAWIKFLAPKLTEILATLRGINIEAVSEWDRRTVKGNVTRLAKALELKVTEKWAHANNSYERRVKDLKEYAEGEVTEYDMRLTVGQYGFVWVTETENGYFGCGKITVAPVSFISLDGTPTVEWVCDTDGFYLSMGSDNRREKSTERYGTLETAIERGKAMCQALIDNATELELKQRQSAQAKLAEIA